MANEKKLYSRFKGRAEMLLSFDEQPETGKRSPHGLEFADESRAKEPPPRPVLNKDPIAASAESMWHPPHLL
jgi:hypothetical protein